MITLPAGGILMALVILFLMGSADASIFVNSHSFAIVVVGSIAVLGLTTPASELRSLLRCLLVMWRPKLSAARIEQGLIEVSRNKEALLSFRHPVIAYAQHLWQQSVEKDMFAVLLRQRIDEENRTYESAVAVLRNLAKYPPALGMTGTVVGLVTVFASLSGEDRSNVGPALAVALTATFYGLLLANALVMPLADRLQVMHLNDVRDGDLLMQKLMMINDGEPIEILGRGAR